MVPDESKPIKTETKKVVTESVKMTRGNVERPDRITWNYMKKEFKLSELQICEMDQAVIPANVSSMKANLIRLFNTDIAKEKGITIEDFASLNEHPELIIYEGYYVHGKGGETIIKKRDGVGTSFLDEKIKEKAITEIGIEIPKTGAQKLLGGFVKFLTMGGIIVILLAGFVIVVLISVLAKSC